MEDSFNIKANNILYIDNSSLYNLHILMFGILNRFSKDIDYVNLQILMNVRMLVNTGMSVVGTVIIMITAMPLFIVIILPIRLVYYFALSRSSTWTRRVRSTGSSPSPGHPSTLTSARASLEPN